MPGAFSLACRDTRLVDIVYADFPVADFDHAASIAPPRANVRSVVSKTSLTDQLTDIVDSPRDVAGKSLRGDLSQPVLTSRGIDGLRFARFIFVPRSGLRKGRASDFTGVRSQHPNEVRPAGHAVSTNDGMNFDHTFDVRRSPSI
jgi:hypothetical protein